MFQEVAAIIQRCCLFITNSSQIFGVLRPELGHCNHSREGLSLPGVSIAEEFDSRFNGHLLLSRGCFVVDFIFIWVDRMMDKKTTR